MFLLLACAPPAEAPSADEVADTAITIDYGSCPVPDETTPWQTWHDGTPAYSIEDFKQRWQGYDGNAYNLWKTAGWETTRFEFADPTCIYAVKATFAGASDAPETIGLYPDFGHNGFDFWSDSPYWTGSAEVEEGGEVTYVLNPPLQLDEPTLVYAASWRDGENGPMLALDGDYVGEGTCGAWDDCHSSLNYPEADAAYYYNGTTYLFPYDFLVSVQAITLSTIPDEDKWFHADPALSAGGNVAWGDYDDDGDDDLMAGGPILYRNDAGVFTDVSSESMVNAWGVGTSGGVWGDYDNDGCLDYYGLGGGYTGKELLLHSDCDGTFTDETLLSGIDDLQSEVSCNGGGEPEQSPTAGATWTDFDNDGLLDLVQANFLCWETYSYYPDRFWHNEGGGVFVEWSQDHGFERDALAGRGAQTIDADLDGDLDINIVDYVLQQNLYYENNGDGTFSERAAALGLAGKSTDGYYGHTIGLAWGDLDNDGDFDAVHANLAHPRFYHFSDRTNLLLQDAGKWSNEADSRGIRYHETHSNPSLLDIENDGDLDLFITEVYDGRPTDVYVNDGAAVFIQQLREAGITTEGGWGSAVSDYDGDGDLDLLANSLFRNDAATGHWLKLRLVGDVASNRSAIGAVAWVTAGGVTRIASVNGGTGTACQDSQTLHFGLGEATSIDAVKVWFPGGTTVEYSGLAVDGGYRLTESGSVSAGLAR